MSTVAVDKSITADVRDVLEANRRWPLTAEDIGDILSWPVTERRVRERLDRMVESGDVEAVARFRNDRMVRHFRLKEERDG